jgi:hypothetical protein
VLYLDLLKSDFDRLPQALRIFHSAPGGGRARGTASVRHASGLLARLAGFPPEGDNVPLQLEVLASENQEVWVRRFGDNVLRSVQRQSGGLIAESFGPVRILLRVTVEDSRMRFVSESVRCWIIPLPLSVRATEWGDEAHWEFDVNVPGLGSYRGMVGPA